jgi:hypothetical protein
MKDVPYPTVVLSEIEYLHVFSCSCSLTLELDHGLPSILQVAITLEIGRVSALQSHDGIASNRPFTFAHKNVLTDLAPEDICSHT